MRTTTKHVIGKPGWMGVVPFRMEGEEEGNTEPPTQQSGSGEEGGVGMPGKKKKEKNISEDE